MKALDRFIRHENGDSAEAIAQEDSISVQTAQTSITDGRKRFELELQKQIVKYKLQGQLENERLRQKVRRRLSGKFLDALERLLDGNGVVISRDKDTGQIRVDEIVDPKITSNGVESYMRSISLLEKPAPAPTIVNVQQNQNNSQQPPGGWSFESMLERIRAGQKSIGPVFEAAVEKVESENQADDKEKNS